MSNFSAKQVHVNFKYYAGNNEYKYLILQEFKYNNIRNEIMFDREKNNVILFLEKIILEAQHIANIIIYEIKQKQSAILLQNYNLDNTSNNNLDNTSNKIYNLDELMYVFKNTINDDKDRLTDYHKIEPKAVEKKFIDYINNKFNPNVNKNVTKFLKIYLNKLDETSKIIKIPFSEPTNSNPGVLGSSLMTRLISSSPCSVKSWASSASCSSIPSCLTLSAFFM